MRKNVTKTALFIDQCCCYYQFHKYVAGHNKQYMPEAVIYITVELPLYSNQYLTRRTLLSQLVMTLLLCVYGSTIRRGARGDFYSISSDLVK